jgi:hypothetical protein
MHMFYRLAGVVLIAALAGCARPQLLGTWVNPNETVTPVSKIMVIGVSKDHIARKLYEEHVLDTLWDLAMIRVTPSYEVVPAKTGTYPDQQQLQQAVQSSGVEAVLTSMVLWVKRDASAAFAFVQPQPLGEAGWRGWSGFYERVFYEAPLSRISDTVIVESYLYDVQRDTLLWSGRTAISTDRMSEIDGIAGMTAGLMQNLLARRLLRATAQ